MLRPKNKNFRIIALILLAGVFFGLASTFCINAFVKNSVSDRIITTSDASQLSDIDCIIVLGCQVKSDGTPSVMLADRIRRGIELYELGCAPKILMSGDHGRYVYNEVGPMRQFALDKGVPSEDIFMDHAGFSTYESIYRVKEIFGAKKILIVTQQYHLYRALYIAEQFGIDAYGVSSDYHTYGGQASQNVREFLARIKDFFMSIFKPKPTYLGEKISLLGDGNVTNG